MIQFLTGVDQGLHKGLPVFTVAIYIYLPINTVRVPVMIQLLTGVDQGLQKGFPVLLLDNPDTQLGSLYREYINFFNRRF